MKKMIGLALLAVLAISWAGCTGGSASSSYDTSKAINVVSREDGSGTRGAFIEFFGVEVKAKEQPLP